MKINLFFYLVLYTEIILPFNRVESWKVTEANGFNIVPLSTHSLLCIFYCILIQHNVFVCGVIDATYISVLQLRALLNVIVHSLFFGSMVYKSFFYILGTGWQYNYVYDRLHWQPTDYSHHYIAVCYSSS